MSYSVPKAVGEFFEIKLAKIFGLIRIDGPDKEKIPDLATRTLDFHIESKGSQKSNGGVIKKPQLLHFEKEYNCPYAFSYHPLLQIAKNFPKKKDLFKELNKKLNYLGTFIFPLEIIKAFYPLKREDIMNYPEYPGRPSDNYVQMIESEARDIFEGVPSIWKQLKLKYNKYKKSQPHEKIHILYEKQHTLDSLLENFNPRYV